MFHGPSCQLCEHSHIIPSVSQTKEDSAAAAVPTAAAASSSSWQDSVSERPPYSYMAMIQFAINSTEKKRMTLKDIYTWIEDHFPYFKHVAKPGWKVTCRPSSCCGSQGDVIISLLHENEKLFPSLQSKMEINLNSPPQIPSHSRCSQFHFLYPFSHST